MINLQHKSVFIPFFNYNVTESAGQAAHARLCASGEQRLAQAYILGLSGHRATLSHVDMQSLYMYIDYLSITLSVFPTPITPPRVGQEG